MNEISDAEMLEMGKLIYEMLDKGWNVRVESHVGTAPLSGLFGKTYYGAILSKPGGFFSEYAANPLTALEMAVEKFEESP